MATGPLASLSKSQYEMGNLIYPSDLGSSRKGHWITFQISVPTASAFNKSGSTIVTQTVNGKIASKTAIAGQNQIASVVNGVVQSISNIATNVSSLWKWTVSPGSTKLVDVISLYTPDTFSIAQHAKYSVASLTDALGGMGFAAATAATISSVLEGGTGKGTEVGTSIKGVALEKVLNLSGNPTIVGAGLRTQGLAVNPQMEVIFKEVDFRTYQFDFLFTPKSAAEAQTVREIVKKFKFHAAPEIDEASGRYFIVPSVFNVQLYFQGATNDNVHKFNLSALETVVVDYAPQGWVTHEDGMPVQTRMTLQFKELEIITKPKVLEGY